METFLKVGQQVTKQPKTWFDGSPVKDWPRADMVGTIVKVEPAGAAEGRKAFWYTIKWASGRKEKELSYARNPLEVVS